MNNITVPDYYPLPIESTIAREVEKACVFSKMDLKDAFNQIRISPGQEWLTAFRTHKGMFQFNVMPFGLKNAPSTLQSMIDSVLRELLGVCVVAYLDDLLIYSENRKDHADHLRAVAQKLGNANLVAKLSKCEFFKSEVTFLGNIILKEGHAICPDKCEAIFNWPTTITQTELKRFMGNVNFLRKFCV